MLGACAHGNVAEAVSKAEVHTDCSSFGDSSEFMSDLLEQIVQPAIDPESGAQIHTETVALGTRCRLPCCGNDSGVIGMDVHRVRCKHHGL